jgi:hypothetical protein
MLEICGVSRGAQATGLQLIRARQKVAKTAGMNSLDVMAAILLRLR